MGKMITCMKCGAKNSSSTIFCSGCGTLLSAMEGRRRRIHREHVHRGIHVVVTLIMLSLFGGGGLALWSRSERIGECGGAEHGRQAALLFSAFSKACDADVVTGRDVRETDINAYVKYVCLDKLPYDALSLDLMPERVRVRTQRTLASWTCGGYCLSPTVSCDYSLRIGEGGVVVEGASTGHLALPGYFARKSYARFLHSLEGRPELALLAKAESMALREDCLHIAFGGK